MTKTMYMVEKKEIKTETNYNRYSTVELIEHNALLQHTSKRVAFIIHPSSYYFLRTNKF